MIDVAVIHGKANTADYIDLSVVGNMTRVDCSNSLGQTIGSAEIEVDGIAAYKDRFDTKDTIIIYAKNGKLNRNNFSASNITTFQSDNEDFLLFVGELNKQSFSWSEGKESVAITADDKTIILTNMVMERPMWDRTGGGGAAPYKIYKDGGNDGNSIIHAMVEEINERMDKVDGWQDLLLNDAYCDETDLDLDAAFPFNTYAEALKELASGAYTNNTQYTYWIDADNYIHWKKLGKTKDFNLIYGSNDIINISFKKDVYDTVNAAIVNAGVDLNGVGIWWYATNEISVGDIGFRWTIMADTLFTKDFESLLYDSGGTKGKGTATAVSGATLTDSTQSWGSNELADMRLINPNRGNSANIVSNTGTTITAAGEGWKKDDYYIYDGDNATFRSSMKAAAVSRAENELAKTAKLRYRGDIVLNGFNYITGSNVVQLNQVYDIEQDYFGFTNSNPKRMRLTDISHNISVGDWSTQLTFKEDVGTEGEQ